MKKMEFGLRIKYQILIKENDMDNKKFSYVYDRIQAKYYMSNGLIPVKHGIHQKTNNPFWVFNREESNQYYIKWRNYKEELIALKEKYGVA